jgi:quercetin dioxygenase-like cupin family protein
MALSHAQPGQVVDVSPLGSRIAQEKTVALFKSKDLEVMRIVLKAGASLPPHKVPGEITIQCVEGMLLVSVDGTDRSLQAGQLLYLGGGVLHDLRAVQDSSALVTVALVR